MKIKSGMLLLFFLIITSDIMAEMIDGPAVIFDSVNGKQIGMLDDGAPVKILSRKAGWTELELKYDGKENLAESPLKRKISLFRKIYGTYGFLNPGFNVKAFKKNTGMTINAYTVESNLKEKVLYYKKFSVHEAELNVLNFKFTDPIAEQTAVSEFLKYESSNSIPDEKTGTVLFVEAGFYKGIPTVVRSFEFMSSGGEPPLLSIKDSYLINESGKLKSYKTNNADGTVKNAECRYYSSGAFRIHKTEINLFAPSSYSMVCSYIVPSGAYSYDVALKVKMNSDMIKFINSVSVIRYSGKEIDFTYRGETKNSESTLKLLKSHSSFREIFSSNSGIDFDKEIIWLQNEISR